jgi:hypothetical protein
MVVDPVYVPSDFPQRAKQNRLALVVANPSQRIPADIRSTGELLNLAILHVPQPSIRFLINACYPLLHA